MVDNTFVYEQKSIATLKEVIAERNPIFKVAATGNSMSPLIKEGDTLSVRAVSSQMPRVGDIVVFDGGGKLCAHRLITKYSRNNQDIFVTKSDKVLVPDAPFTSEKLLGRVVAIQRGRRVLRLDSPFWMAANRIIGAYHLLLLSVKKGIKRIVGTC